jgi:hypothetical protein
MRKITLLFLLIVASATAFAQEATTSPEIISVNMHRTACFGRCPDYTIEISKNGTATYTAIRFNTDTGIYKKNIGTKKARAILKEFATYRVDTCREMYENRIPDLPGIYYIIKYQGRTQKIANANFGPAFLKSMAEEMDKIGKKEGKGWKKTGMPKLD